MNKKASDILTLRPELIISILFVVACLFTSCGSIRKTKYDRELQKLRELSLTQLSAQSDEFNRYKNRPASDGPYNETNNKDFLLANIPLFISSDSTISKVYNYRWWMISKHLKEYADPYDHKKYWVITEFFGVKPWASLSGAITCPAGHQFYDVRWLRDPKYVKSYADYFIRGSASKLNQRENGNFLTYLSRPESHHFSSWMINGIEATLKIHPDRQWMNDMLPAMEKHQQVWDSLFTVRTPASKTFGMYKILDLYDGMEFSLSAILGLIESKGAYALYTNENWRKYYLGWETTASVNGSAHAKNFPKAFRGGYPDFYLVRPSVNSYAFGNLRSLAQLYSLDMTGDRVSKHKATYYAERAEATRQKTLNTLWNMEMQFFNTYSAGDNEFGIQDFEAKVRESVGYTPWYFDLIPEKDYKSYSRSWDMLSSRKGFYNEAGMTTAEQQHPYYNEQAYAWNGRGWPFENSIVYKGYAKFLRDYKKSSTANEKELLYDYINKLAKMHGPEPNIGEWYIPSSGRTFGGESDYFHSTFPDIIIEDLLGFKAMHTKEFMISPLLPKNKWKYFYLGNLSYHGHDIDIVWKEDWDPDLPGKQGRLCVWVDQNLVATTKDLNDRLIVHLPK